jgi:hypothetical protein
MITSEAPSDQILGATMTYAFTQDVPIDAGLYNQIIDGLGDDAPKGLIVHLAVERPEGGLRYIDVWDTEKDWDDFAEERLHPVVHPLLNSRYGETPPEPDRLPLPVLHVWQP